MQLPVPLTRNQLLKEVRREIREENERKEDKLEKFGEGAVTSVLQAYYYVVFKKNSICVYINIVIN